MTVALLELPSCGVVVREVTLRERIAARLHGAALDRALVAGVPPEAEVGLTRRRIAKTLEGIVDATRRVAVPPARPVGRQVPAAAPDLLALAERLERPGPVDARGVALARELLRDGRGPLYADRGGRRLAAA